MSWTESPPMSFKKPSPSPYETPEYRLGYAFGALSILAAIVEEEMEQEGDPADE